jgi:hypothetical protein
MVKRASMVSGFQKGTLYRTIAMVVNVSLILLLPFILAKNGLYKGYINENGVCVSLCTQIWEPALFLGGIIFLSVALLYLFLEPLRSLRRTIDSQSPHRLNLAKVIRRNILLTTIALVTSILNICFYNAVDALVLNSRSEDYLLILTLFFANFDVTVNGLSIKLMHNISIPIALQGSKVSRCCMPNENTQDPDEAATLSMRGRGPSAILPSDNRPSNVTKASNGLSYHGHYSIVLN